MRHIFTTLVAIAISTQFVAAEPGMTATIHNMHLWRGGEVADGLVVTTDVHFTDASEHLTIGFWGGTNAVGEYKEFNYYLKYQHNRLSFTLVDTYNFSDYATYNNKEFFNYRPSETGRFLDANLVYEWGEDLPLTLRWATILFGRDRDAENLHNRFSTYCSATYSVYRKERWTIDLGVGSAFTLNNVDESKTFYSDYGGIVEATVTVGYLLPIRKYTMPISVVAMWNPQNDRGYLQLNAQVVTF